MELAGFLEKCQKKQGNDNKKRLFKGFLDQWRNAYNLMHKNDKQTVSM